MSAREEEEQAIDMHMGMEGGWKPTSRHSRACMLDEV